MNWFDLLYKIVPLPVFVFLRNIFRKYQSIRYPRISEAKFKTLLREELGVKKGMVVFVHSSLDKLNIDFSPIKLLDLLKEAVGEEGTLLFPCWHYKGRAEDFLNQDNAVFNVNKSATTMGLLPELARRSSGAIRSLHPTASVVAVGKLAYELTFEHHLDVYPNGIKSPLYKLMNYDSRIIGLGERVISLSFVHVVEDIMKKDFPIETLQPEVRNLKVINYDGDEEIVKTLIPSINIAKRDTFKFIKKHVSAPIHIALKINGVNFFSVKPLLFYSKIETLAKEGITIYNS
ncbi:MAG TPA: hypothetical protein DCG69_01415 [Bacteroidales bacterium]|nr:hypothetical protein [Bacteroidales bacterium]